MIQCVCIKFILNGNVNIVSILTVKLTSDSDVALNKHTAGPWALVHVWLISCNDSMSPAMKKRLLRLSAM